MPTRALLFGISRILSGIRPRRPPLGSIRLRGRLHRVALTCLGISLRCLGRVGLRRRDTVRLCGLGCLRRVCLRVGRRRMVVCIGRGVGGVVRRRRRAIRVAGQPRRTEGVAGQPRRAVCRAGSPSTVAAACASGAVSSSGRTIAAASRTVARAPVSVADGGSLIRAGIRGSAVRVGGGPVCGGVHSLRLGVRLGNLHGLSGLSCLSDLCDLRGLGELSGLCQRGWRDEALARRVCRDGVQCLRQRRRRRWVETGDRRPAKPRAVRSIAGRLGCEGVRLADRLHCCTDGLLGCGRGVATGVSNRARIRYLRGCYTRGCHAPGGAVATPNRFRGTCSLPPRIDGGLLWPAQRRGAGPLRRGSGGRSGLAWGVGCGGSG
eukprot:m.131146 g.131146  ORF g.131146 m.131146 type:complete len:377 (+) comp9466_c0_seq1:3746-4876(+)